MKRTLKGRLGAKMVRLGSRWMWQGIVMAGLSSAARHAARNLRR